MPFNVPIYRAATPIGTTVYPQLLAYEKILVFLKDVHVVIRVDGNKYKFIGDTYLTDQRLVIINNTYHKNQIPICSASFPHDDTAKEPYPQFKNGIFSDERIIGTCYFNQYKVEFTLKFVSNLYDQFIRMYYSILNTWKTVKMPPRADFSNDRPIAYYMPDQIGKMYVTKAFYGLLMDIQQQPTT